MTDSPPTHFHVAVAGTGFGGLGTAIRLRQEGIEDFVVFERADDVGGVWRDNTYPGCACDVQSHLYSFSFAPNPNWSRSYSPQREIHAYLRDCAARFGVMSHVRFGHEVHKAIWEDDRKRWRIETSRGVFTADVFVAGMGALSEPSIPKLPGLASFEGKVMHSARWDHAHDLAGRHVAVVGTGASAIQFVPQIQPLVAKLSIFQRTPPWIMPRGDYAISPAKQRIFRAAPGAQWLSRNRIFATRELLVLAFREPRVMRLAGKMSARYLASQVRDPVLRRKLTPDYTFGCKRILISDDYLASLTKDNVEVLTSALREVRPRSMVAADGTERAVDTILFGTGFHVTDPPIANRVVGRGGRTLADVWQGSPHAHLGTTIAGFPSFFLLAGPNTGLGHSSMITMIEAQIEHVLGALRFMRSGGLSAVEPRRDAQAAFIAEVDAKMQGTVWTSGGCASWYLDSTGRNSTLWPGFSATFAYRVARFDPAEYVATMASSYLE